MLIFDVGVASRRRVLGRVGELKSWGAGEVGKWIDDLMIFDVDGASRGGFGDGGKGEENIELRTSNG